MKSQVVHVNTCAEFVWYARRDFRRIGLMFCLWLRLTCFRMLEAPYAAGTVTSSSMLTAIAEHDDISSLNTLSSHGHTPTPITSVTIPLASSSSSHSLTSTKPGGSPLSKKKRSADISSSSEPSRELRHNVSGSDLRRYPITCFHLYCRLESRKFANCGHRVVNLHACLSIDLTKLASVGGLLLMLVWV
jgi:hypothetical protein